MEIELRGFIQNKKTELAIKCRSLDRGGNPLDYDSEDLVKIIGVTEVLKCLVEIEKILDKNPWED